MSEPTNGTTSWRLQQLEKKVDELEKKIDRLVFTVLAAVLTFAVSVALLVTQSGP